MPPVSVPNHPQTSHTHKHFIHAIPEPEGISTSKQTSPSLPSLPHKRALTHTHTEVAKKR